MDRPRGVRRGVNRFSTARLRAKQSGHKFRDGLDGIEGDFEFPVKSKKEKVRSLSAVGRALSSCEENKMGCDVTEKVDALRVQSPSSNTIAASKRFKISKRFSDDGNGVGHASVPRKLRSAVKKRNREYSLPDSEKVSHKVNGIESVKDGIKKPKVSMQQGNPAWSTRQTVSGPITKDEEEVVETLYALSGMFLNNDSSERLKLEGDSSPENSNIQEFEKSTNDAFEGSGTAQDSRPFYAERSSGEAAIVNSSIDSNDRKQPDIIEDAELMTSDNVGPNLNMDTTPMLIRNENGNEAALDDSELSLAVGFSMSRQSPKLRYETTPETAGVVESKQVHRMMKDQVNNDGPTLWPGLALASSAGSQASYSQSSSAKAPVWRDAARCASKQYLTQGDSPDVKISEVVAHKKLWKNCEAHVYISNFIRSLQEKNSKGAQQQASHSNQPSANGGSIHGDLREVRNSNRARSGITAAPGPGHSDTAEDLQDNKNSVQQSCFYHESLIPDVYGHQKKGLDLSSLSTGGNGLQVNNILDQSGGSRLESLPKLQMPYFHPLAQLQGLMRFPVPQSQYASPSYHTHQISAAGPQVLPHYYGNSLWASNNKHQQESFWAVQLPAQGRSGVNCNIMRPQYPKWETESVVNPTMIPQSSASPQVVGSKFVSIPEQQQQQFMSLASSLPQSRTKGLNFLAPPSVCEQDRTSRFTGSHGTPSSLQLLCDERI